VDSGGNGGRFSPVTTVIAASVLTIVLLIGLGWQVRQSYLDHKFTEEKAFPVGQLRDEIIHLDEVLTMSANMAAATGDPQWENRYRRFEPQLDAAIKSLQKLMPENFDIAAVIQTDEANIKLVGMENQVFELVDQGRLDEAQAILSSDDYREQKGLYADGMERLEADMENYITADLESNRKRAQIAIISVLLGLPLLTLIWLWVLQNMRRYLKERNRAEEALKLQFNLEELLTSISTEFISLEPDEIDDGIGRALESIIDSVCVDRGYIFLYSPDGGTMDNTYEFCRTGVPPHKDRLQDVPVERFAWFDARMKRFETVAVDSVATLTEEAEASSLWLYENIQSLLCVPMVFQGRLMGFVGFDTVLYETQWREEIITFVKILGTVFANALERKHFGQERQRLLKTLAAKNEELQSVVYVASHDLKSPLVNIQGFSGELSRSCAEFKAILGGEDVPAALKEKLASLMCEDVPESLGFIRAGTLKMQALLDGLLEVCRVGSAVLQIQALDMNEMIKHIIASMQFQINDSGADVIVDDLPGCIGDGDHVNQVFSNLLTNAVKYLDADRKGEIHISGRGEDGESIYCVQDNGLGIASQHQDKVFEIFHRLDPDRHADGEGLGLTIAMRIIQRHEGRIWVESEPGKGSMFFVSLPAA